MIFKKHQKWLENSIPSKKTDNSVLVRELLFKILVHFFEDEHALTAMPWNEDELHKKVIQELEHSYIWITEERPLLADKVVQLWDSVGYCETSTDRDKVITEVNSLEEKILERDCIVLTQIVKYREFLNII